VSNITDFDPETGRTTTVFDPDHDRGSTDYNVRKGLANEGEDPKPPKPPKDKDAKVEDEGGQ
jgi:hypothetical protein